MADPAVLKAVKIKTGVLKRLVKEHASYIREVEKETAKVEKMTESAQTEDELYNVKKAKEVLQETRMMIGDTARRCATGLKELQNLLAESSLPPETQELIDAEEQVRLAGTVVPA